MKRSTRKLAGIAAAAVIGVGTMLAVGSPAQASPSSCTVNPPNGQHGGPTATVTCPAGAGTFTFRVAVVCADAYPNLHLFNAAGPWVQASNSVAKTSSFTCHGYVPGSGFTWSAAIEVQ